MSAASLQPAGLRVAAPDGCNVADHVPGILDPGAVPPTDELEQPPARIHGRPYRGSAHTHPTASGHFTVPVPCALPFVRGIGGKVFYAPLRLSIRDGKFREPDLLLVTDADDPRCRNDYSLAEARILNPNPLTATVTVLVLSGGEYREHTACSDRESRPIQQACPASRWT